ncbi:MAG: hypothetical protein AAF456_10440 [Planctomycetota bacterium]
MKHLEAFFRLLAIVLVSPAAGFGTLFVIDGLRIIKPGNMDKGTFIFIGFAVAIATGIVLMKCWPSPLAKEATNLQASEDKDESNCHS